MRGQLTGSMLSMTLGLMCVVMAGCNEEPVLEPGAIELLWAPGPTTSCAAAELEQIEVELRRGGEPFQVHWFDCDLGGAYLQAVAPGRYDIVVAGIDALGVRTFEGRLPGVRLEEGEHIHIGTVRMSARPADIELTWFFENGRLCAQNGVDQVQVDIYDGEYTFIASEDFGCDAGSARLQPLAAGRYVIEVMGLDGGERIRARNVLTLDLERGEDVYVEAGLIALP